ncbi:MAG: hypothetical protein WBI65_02055 [Dethiobacteria bacterium]|nr:hypothetical protein [Bacillota bacterium]
MDPFNLDRLMGSALQLRDERRRQEDLRRRLAGPAQKKGRLQVGPDQLSAAPAGEGAVP